MIGRRTGTGRVTNLGAARPDDPVFKEGRTVSMMPQSLQKSPEPSDSTLDEVDESEDAMRDALSGKVIRCRHCNSADECEHWHALINWDFPTDPSGYCTDKFDEFRELTERAFLSHLQSATERDYKWGDPELNDLWRIAFDNFQHSKTSVWIDSVVVANFVLDLFSRSGGEKYPGSIENCLGPGCSSVWSLYYAKNPASVLDAALSELKKLLTPELKASSLKTRRVK